MKIAVVFEACNISEQKRVKGQREEVIARIEEALQTSNSWWNVPGSILSDTPVHASTISKSIVNQAGNSLFMPDLLE